MSNNPFGNMTAEGLESTDTLGGGRQIFNSDVYDATIKLAFYGESSGGARFMTFHFDINGQEYKETVYVTSNKTKGQKNYSERGGVKSPLPGFSVANDLALLSTGKDLFSQEFEEKIVKLWDFDQKAEIPTKVQAATSMHELQVKLGIRKIIENKQAKSDAGYVDTNEKREKNEINKVFHFETGKTVSEFTAKVDEASFINDWTEKFRGVDYNKFKEVGNSGTPGGGGGSSAAGGGAAKSQTSLFG